MMMVRISKSNITISVVIPNWNGEGVILDCLKSIASQSHNPIETIVVDNGSIDNSIELIKNNYPGVVVIRNKKNLGFAEGVNIGIRAAKAEYVFLLNNDAECEKDCLSELIKTATKEKSDITQAVILTANGKLIDSVGDEYSTWGLPYPGMRNQPASQLPDADKAIFSASGGASLYKKSLFDEVGYFDSSFFAYYEDVDISMRAQLMGKTIYLSSKAIVHHKMNYTADKIPGFGREMAIKNSIYLFWKNLPFPLILKVLPRSLYSNIRMTGAALTKGYSLAAIKAQLTALVNFPSIIIKRRHIQSTKKISSAQFEHLLSKQNPLKAVKKL